MEERDDGTLFVSGVASAESVDSQGEVITSDAMKAALPDFFKHGSGNLREMHQMIAAGRVDKAEIGADGKTYIECIVVDPVAVKKVQTGTYKGFSVGGRALSKTDGVISSLRLTEISLVDRPANPDAVISVWKAEGADEQDQDGGAPSAGAGESQPTHVPEVTKAVDESVEKGMYNMQRLIEALQCIKTAMSDAAYEQKYGEHSPEMLADMKAAYLALGAVAQKYLGEELNPPAKPVEMSMADGIDNVDVLKAGAMYSKGTKAALANIHKMLRDCDKAMCDMGYDKGDMDKADEGQDLSKAQVGTITADDELKKAATDAGLTVADKQSLTDLAKAAVAELTKAQARVKELEAQPEPAKAAVTTIDKDDDTKDGLAAGGSFQPDPNDPLSMFKAALARPLVVGSPISKPSSAN
jgi:hypothetical protein